MKSSVVWIFSIAILLGLASSVEYASAAVLFSDNFDSENGGTGVLNYDGFAQWSVSDGTVDLIGNGFFDFLPGNGLYIDMDGSTSNAGKITSDPITVGSNSACSLEYELAGNHRNSASEEVVVQMNNGDILDVTQSLSQNDPFTLFSHDFVIDSTTDVKISFEGTGSDNIGMLLDDVKLSCTTDKVVGGSFLAIDNVALFLGTIQAGMIWMIPTLAGLAGGSIYLIKFRTNKGS